MSITSVSLTPNTNSFDQPPAEEYHEISEEEIAAASDAEGQEATDTGGSTPDVEASSQQDATDNAAPSEDVVASVLQKNGLSYSDFSDEISKNGSLSAESYGKLAKSGFTKEMVDTYVAGIKSTEALGEQHVQDVMAVVGGKEKFSDLISWASKNLTTAEQDAYNSMVSGNNPNTAKAAVEWLQSKQRAVEGYTPTLVPGSQKKSSSHVRPFANSEQVIRAMSDPRYKTDSDYRKAVSRRLSISEV